MPPGSALDPLAKERGPDRISYPHVTAVLDREAGTAEITVTGPDGEPPADAAGILRGRARASGRWR